MAADDESTFDEVARSHTTALERLAGPSSEYERMMKTLKAASPCFALEELMRSSGAGSAYSQALETLSRIPAIDSDMQHLFESIGEQTQLARAAIGPLEDLKRLGVLDDVHKVAFEHATISEAIGLAQRQFRLPEFAEANRLAQQIVDLSNGLGAIKLPDIPGLMSLEAAMAQMHSPWLDIERTLESAQGFAALQSIGDTIEHWNTFEPDIASQLRRHLGDWRDSIIWPANIEDISARTAFYIERGLDTSLTDFPSPAFEESISVARLNRPAPRVVELNEYDIAGETDDERRGFERTRAAQDRLLRFEYHLRRFIDGQMKAIFGENWIDAQVDDETRSRWLKKQQAALEKGERVYPLIDYADFADYERVILRRDNWKQVFQPVFRKRESVQESLQRLYPVRICSYHARLITQDDELLLYVEVKRILKAIGMIDASS